MVVKESVRRSTINEKAINQSKSVIDLPYDNPKKKIKKSSISSLHFVLDSSEIDDLFNDFINTGSGTTEEALLTTLSLLLYKYKTNKEESFSIGLNNSKFIDQVVNVNFNKDDTFISSVLKISKGVYINETILKEQSNSPVQFSYYSKFSSNQELGIEYSYPTPINGYFDLHLVCERQQDKVLATLYYNDEMFKEETVLRIIEHYKTLFHNCIIHKNEPIDKLNVLPDKEKNLILSSFNDTEHAFELDTTLVALFEEQVKKSPNAIALIYNQEKLTYRDLNERANQLAHHLKESGINKGDIIGVYFERSMEMVVSLYAVIKAGGAYLPLDPTHPKERVSFILEDANVPVVLTHKSIKEKLPKGSHDTICVDSDERIQIQPFENLGIDSSPEDLAYVIYTSGSTGNPKGVVIQHQGIVNRLKWMQKEYNLKESDRVLQKTPYSFDVSVWELFWPLQIGATLVIAKPEGHKDSIYLTEIIQTEQITVVHFVPSMLQLFLDYDAAHKCSSLRLVYCSGEALPFHLQEKFFKSLGAELHNLYGPTEASVDVTYWKCVENSQKNIVPIGKPISNIKLYILDQNLNPVPIGIPGELYISGIGLAKEYLNRKDLNSERFINNPYGSGNYSRLYKTGDLAKYGQDGNIEYLGRLDFQVKIRGLRIELGEIETLLCKYKGVKECLVSATKDKTGDDQLVAYLVTKEKINLNDVKEFLKSKLPEYMIPLFFVFIEQFPLSPNGKIDRKQLPKPKIDQFNLDREILLPTTNLEQKIFDIWSDVLGVKEFSINDTFLSLGGHSLKAMQVITKLRNENNLELNISDMLVNKTVYKLARFIEDNQHKLKVNSNSIKKIDKLEKPASLAQERMWFLTELNNDLSAYNITNVLRLSGTVNYKIIKETIERIVLRHEALRTKFYSKDGNLYQKIQNDIEIELLTSNIEKEENIVNVAEDIVIEESKHLFDIKEGPLFRVKLIKLSDECHWLVLVFHHIVYDGWSESLFYNEFIKIYESNLENKPLSLPELEIGFSDYSSWQREELEKDRLKLQIKYWENKLDGYTGNFELPTDKKRGKVQSFNGSQCRFKISHNLLNKLKVLGEQEGATLYTTLLAAFKVLLYRLTGINDTVIGSPVASRNNTQVENLIGYFVNTLVLRTKLSADKSFIETLKVVNNTSLEALGNQDIPFDKLVEVVSPERDISRNPLFQIAFVLQNTHFNTKNLFSNNMLLDTLEVDTKISRFDLSLILKETIEGIECFFEYNTNLFYDETIRNLVKYYLYLLEQIVENPEREINSFQILSYEEQNILLENGIGEQPLYKEDKTTVELFEEVVAAHYNKMAVKYYNSEISYDDLNKRSNQLAHYLIENNVRKGSKVGICLNRSIDFIVSLLGVMKAGAVYVPIDPNYPAERINFILNDSEPEVVVTDNGMNNIYNEWHGNTIFISDIRRVINSYPNENIKNINYDIDDLAYIIYTSGSTGTPKGVMVPHKGLCNVVSSSIHEFKFKKETRMLQFSSMSFDASVWEIFMTLLSGASLHLSTPENYLDVIKEQNINFAFLPPAVLSVLKLEELPTLETIITGGEVCPKNLVNRIVSKVNKVNLYNAYGPTEASICTTIAKCVNDGNEPPIGKPIPGSQVYILDDYLNIVPFGYPGELYIGGLGITKGYLNRPELDDKSFINNPFNNNEKIYKTGDIVRFRYDNQIEYLGRKDKQVKVRGLRIELGEIEFALNSMDEIKHSIVIPDENNQNLLGFIILNKDIRKESINFKNVLSNKLPRHMVPNNIYEISDIPITTNGKIDKAALLAYHSEKKKYNNPIIRMPENELERKIKNIWSSVLKSDQIGIDDNYFEIGGQSLSALQVIARIKEECQVDITLADFFRNPAISRLAKFIDANKNIVRNESIDIILENAPEDEILKASPAQESLWLLQEMNTDSTTYNIPVVLELTGELNISFLNESINILVQRHQSLRTVLFENEGHIIQKVTSGDNIYLKVIDSNTKLDQDILEIINREVSVPFNLTEGPLFRTLLYKLSENRHYLVIVTHHVIFDGWSRTIMLNELATIYNSFKYGKPHTLNNLKYQYKDYTYSKNKKMNPSRIKKSLDFYKNKLQGAKHYINLPKDRGYFKNSGLSKKHVSFEIDQSKINKMKLITSKSETTNYMLLLTVTKTLLYKLSNQKDIVIGTPIANRNNSTIESIIGYFVNTLAIRTDISEEPTFMELLSRVKNSFLETFEHNDIPYEKVIEVVKPDRVGATSSLFNVMFNMLNLPNPEIELDNIKTKVIDGYDIDSKFDLNFYVEENKENIIVNIVYNNKLFSEERMLNLSNQYKLLLSQIVDDPNISIEDYSLHCKEDEGVLPNPNIPLNYVEEEPLINVFRKTAKAVPTNIAVVDTQTVLTYEQLDKLSNKVARHLISKGVEKGDYIALLGERSSNFIVSLFGIIKTGAVFYVLNPSYPVKRSLELVNSLSPKFLVHGSNLPNDLKNVLTIPELQLTKDNIGSLEDSNEDINVPITGKDNSYVLFTSGTTGIPKMIMNTHTPLSNFIKWHSESSNFNNEDRFSMLSGLSHDPILRDVFTPIVNGAALHIPENDDLLDSDKMREWFTENEITVSHMTPQFGYILTEGKNISEIKSLNSIFFSGDTLTIDLVKKLTKIAPNVVCTNFYGSTETPQAMSYETISDVNNHGEITLGKPITNEVQLLIMNDSSKLCGFGEVGEICIRTPYLSKGYINDKKLNDIKFIINPFTNKKEDLIYKTGDIGYYLTDGRVVFCGRKDNQVKIRGYRVELSEIEATLKKLSQVKNVVVNMFRDNENSESLVAYINFELNIEGEIEELRSYLNNLLPSYMVPKIFIKVDKIPLTSNGKVDWSQLPVPIDYLKEQEIKEVDMTEDEEKVKKIWEELLKTPVNSVNANFFNLGGHSLLVTRLISRIEDVFDLRLPLRFIFEKPTIKNIVDEISRIEHEKEKAIEQELRELLGNTDNLDQILEELERNS